MNDSLTEPTSSETSVPDIPTEFDSHRLSLALVPRVRYAATSGAVVGFTLGLIQGRVTTGLRFLAENSHRLPTTSRGWYTYHQAKNYASIKGALREGSHMGFKLGAWTGLLFLTEDAIDVYRECYIEPWWALGGERDAISTVLAGASVAGAFSLWNRLPLVTAARMTKLGMLGGLGYGLVQDAAQLLKGERLVYVDWTKRILGLGRLQNPGLA